MKRHTILVVDDEQDILDSVRDLLRMEFKVVTTNSAAQAIELMKAQEVHIVMTDQRMPSMTGVEFLKAVRGDYPDAIRLLFTGYADIQAVIDAINQGNVYRYITKPWDPRELVSIIREACERFDLIVERRQLLTQLEQKNAELQKANSALKVSDELKTAFIQVASHELRTPVALLRGLIDVVKRGKADAIMKDWPDRAQRAVERLTHLVDEVSTQLQCGLFKQLTRHEDVDVARLLNDAANDVRPFANLRGQQLQIKLNGDTGTAQLDACKIRDALHHLLLNAIKFTPDGGTITLSAGDGDPLKIAISDSGIGIDPSLLPRIFDPFVTQADVSHHSSGEYGFNSRGIGLGLSIVRAFCRLHGGDAVAESQPDKGSTFTMVLPRRS
jgi:signal transduction histidine kinase